MKRLDQQFGECYLSVALGVLQEAKNELSGLLGPTGLGGKVVLLGLSVPANAAVVPPERHGLLVLDDILEELDGLPVAKTLDGGSRLPGVLEVNTEVGAPSLSG